MPGMIKKEDIEKVRAAADLYDIVSASVSLKPSGTGTFVGLCPFHDEKTGSFNVRPALGVWHCFGCGLGGDVFKFVEEQENIDFREAVELLDRLGIAAPRTRVEKLSRGEMQRVALARAFMNDCRLLFADEPTASLDAANADQVADLLRGLCRERRSALICVTHDARLMAGLDHCVRLDQGRLKEVA